MQSLEETKKSKKKDTQTNGPEISKKLLEVWGKSGNKPQAVVDQDTKPCEVLVLYDNIKYDNVIYHIHYHVHVDPSTETADIRSGGGHVINTALGEPEERGSYVVHPGKIGKPDDSVTADLGVAAAAIAHFKSMNEKDRKEFEKKCAPKKQVDEQRAKQKAQEAERKKVQKILQKYKTKYGALQIDKKGKISAVDKKKNPVEFDEAGDYELLKANIGSARQEAYDIYYRYDVDYDQENADPFLNQYLYGYNDGIHQERVDNAQLIGFDGNHYEYGEFGIITLLLFMLFMMLIPICCGIGGIVGYVGSKLSRKNKEMQQRNERNISV